jgi:integrase
MKSEQNAGTIRTIRNRRGEVVGYQALLPRALSIPPRGCCNRDYRQPVGEVLPTFDETRTLLDGAIRGRLKNKPTTLLSVAHYVAEEIQARQQAARRRYETEARARRATASWRSLDRNWLKPRGWYDAPAVSVDLQLDLAPFFRELVERADGPRGKPLSAHFVHSAAAFLRAVFNRAGLEPNPMERIDLPDREPPRVPHLDLAQQRRFFQTSRGADSKGIATPTRRLRDEDLVMVGCGMGAGLRVGELLSIEVTDVHVDRDPHLVVRYGGPDHAPPKGKRIRRVELVEPGLGFWRLWMERFYRGGALVFEGPRGGYQKHWPELFPGWARAAGAAELTSHIMRHTYAVAMLSGSWGYEPKGLDFVQQQLGHADRKTTERYYGAFEVGTWAREARAMRGDVTALRRPITAAELLGLGPEAGASSGATVGAIRRISRAISFTGVDDGNRAHERFVAENLLGHEAEPGATHRSTLGRVERALEALAAADPTAVAQAIDALGEARQVLIGLLAAEQSAREARDRG